MDSFSHLLLFHLVGVCVAAVLVQANDVGEASVAPLAWQVLIGGLAGIGGDEWWGGTVAGGQVNGVCCGAHSDLTAVIHSHGIVGVVVDVLFGIAGVIKIQQLPFLAVKLWVDDEMVQEAVLVEESLGTEGAVVVPVCALMVLQKFCALQANKAAFVAGVFLHRLPWMLQPGLIQLISSVQRRRLSRFVAVLRWVFHATMINQVHQFVGAELTLLALEAPRGRLLARGLVWVVLPDMALQSLFAVGLKGADWALLHGVLVRVMEVTVGSDDLDGAVVLVLLLVLLHVAFPLCGVAALVADVRLLLGVERLVPPQLRGAVCDEGAVEAVVLPLIDEAVEHHRRLLRTLLWLGGGRRGRGGALGRRFSRSCHGLTGLGLARRLKSGHQLGESQGIEAGGG